MWRGLIEAYRDRLPVTDSTPVITLHEGNTPLLPAPVLSDRTGCDVYLKVEGANPTGSFKDRGMTVAVSKAVEARRQGDHLRLHRQHLARRAAAYAARAGITCAVLVPQGKIALGKLAQALVHGAKLLQVDGNFDDCLGAGRASCRQDYPVALVNSVNPDRLHGQKTAAFEIVDGARRRARHPLPAGRQRRQHHRLLDGLQRGPRRRQRHASPADVRLPGRRRRADRQRRGGRASRRPSPPRSGSATRRRWTKALDARDESGGLIDAVTDREILAAYRLLAREVGVFVELGSAASVAGLLQAAAAGQGAARLDASSARSPATASRTRSGRSPPRRRRPRSGTTCCAARPRSLDLA